MQFVLFNTGFDRKSALEIHIFVGKLHKHREVCWKFFVSFYEMIYVRFWLFVRWCRFMEDI